jgi:hypothetical protein
VGNAKKILAKMRNNPRDWHIEDLKVLAHHFGIPFRQHGTSHVGFEFPAGTLPVPAKRPIKAVYIRQFLSQVESVQNTEEAK